MNKRRRKKLHIGEFIQLGFEASFKCAPGLAQPDREQLLVDFLENAIEENDLLAGGGGDENMSLFIVSTRKYGSATDEERNRVREWLAKEKRIEAFEVSDPKDAWHEGGVTLIGAGS